MIGNDVVDLSRSSSSWKRKRFLEKVYTEAEQKLIFSALHPHQMAWLLWSMKEAAYKIRVQQCGKRSFHPTRLICRLTSNATGVVTIDKHTYITSSTISDRYIHTVARLNNTAAYQSAVFEVQDQTNARQSVFINDRFIEKLAQRAGLDEDQLKIIKNAAGVPSLLHSDVKLPLHISFTHCGNYCGYVYAEELL